MPKPESPDQLVTIIRGLRRRIHMLECHNQHFERCESAWCNPADDANPALEMGRPEVWPYGLLPKPENPVPSDATTHGVGASRSHRVVTKASAGERRCLRSPA